MILNTEMLNRTPIALLAACGLSLGLAGTPAAVQAQYSDDEESMEWDNDEGYHEEEWYDPSDWFDDDFDGIEGADTDFEYDTVYSYDDEDYDSNWWYEADRTMYVDGYYDGYYDGYDGAEAVYDTSSDRSSSGDSNKGEYRRSQGYASGYKDGKNDASSNAGSDWTYYIFATPVSDQQSQNRQANSDRKRGERAKEAKTQDLNQQQAKQMAEGQNMQRVRGTISKIEEFKSDRLGEKMKDHTVLRLTMEDGDQIVCDLGPNANSDVLSKGDRVTIKGKRTERDGRAIFDAAKLSVNDEVLWNSKSSDEPTKVSQR